VAELVKVGKTFRKVGAAVIAERLGVGEEGIREALDVKRALKRRDLPGAPHPVRVGKEARAASKRAAAVAKAAERWLKPCAAENLLRDA
jgi:hypothetical protein